MLERFWRHIRSKYIPKKLSRYGSVALHIFDERSFTEKIADKIDNYFFTCSQNKRELLARKSRFHINWTDSLGNTSARIKELEKQGYAYASDREWEQVANRGKARIEQERGEKIKKKVEFCASEIKKGRKYTQEWHSTLQKMRVNG